MPQVLPLSLQNRRPGRIRPELGPLRETLHRLGDPHLACPSILIVGTNGKGSTAAMIEAVLRSHGVMTGLTTSPHLVSVEERIRIGGRRIESSRLEHLLGRLATYEDLTFFETLTCAAFMAFADAGVEVAVLEAGMGGSWDATRVAESAIVGITNVGNDHAAWLGEDIVERARDKGDPLRAARWAVIGPGLDEKLILAVGAPAAVPAKGLVEIDPVADGRLRITWDNHTIYAHLPLVGAHQIDNLNLALALVRSAAVAGIAPPLEPVAVARGLADLRWPGRLSEITVEGRAILVDGAHNPEGALALAAHLGRRAERRNLVFSCLDDKDVEAMAEALLPAVGEIAVCRLEDDRAMPLDRIAAAFPGAIRAPSVSAALESLPDPVVAAGSLRLVGALIEAAEEGAEG